MPIGIAVGRRIVLLVATVIMILSAGLCAGATSYEWHLAGRIILGLSAGQSEALVPMITQVHSTHISKSWAHLTMTRKCSSSTSEAAA
jgi:predicted MFS family arabinose efflux permease